MDAPALNALNRPIRWAGVAALVLVGILALTASDIPPASIRVEAEDLVARDSTASLLEVGSDTHASNNLTVFGFNSPGVWIECLLTLPTAFRFQTAVHSAGTVGLVRTYEVMFTPEGGATPAAVDTVVTPPGLGAG